MNRYHYQLPAAVELGSTMDTLTGTIDSQHPLTDQELRHQAIEQAPREYIHFGPIDITEGTDQ
ncbi:hypothetical protein [Aeromonas sp. R7-1]|uniref:hypothetical protein n=1 Tax=Aeromonas sp. R7-1 TaxID=3138473 RepID=UPI0034A13DC1